MMWGAIPDLLSLKLILLGLWKLMLKTLNRYLLPISHEDKNYLATFGLDVDCNDIMEKNTTTSAEYLPGIVHPSPTLLRII